MEVEERISWKEYFKLIVTSTSKRSNCKKLKVGCLLVKDNRIISQGYNGFIGGHPHQSVIVDNHELGTIHAEQNAIIDCAKRGVSCSDCVAYVTHFPCINCLKCLVQAGITNIYYIHDYKNDYNLIEKLGIKIDIVKI
jgi:dCMP deaminase